jgi:hypothetical protein
MAQMIAHPADPSGEPIPLRRRLARVHWLLWTGLGLVLACAVYAVVWFQVATALRGGIEAWVVQQRSQGVEIGFEHLQVTGFPFAWRARIEAPLIQASAPAAPQAGAASAARRLLWRWRPERVTLTVEPWRPATWLIDTPGAHAFEFATRAGTSRITGEIARLQARYARAVGGGALSITAGAASGVAEPGGEFAFGGLTFMGRLPPPQDTADHLTVTADGTLNATAIRLPAAWASPLASTVETLAIALQVMGPIAPPFDAAALADWRDDGGTVEVSALGFTHGTLTVDASGTLALDRELQPIGAFTAKAQGFLQAVDALQAAGVIAPRDAVTARIVLSALARRDGAGSSSLSIPVQIQAGILHAGPVPLLSIPRIVWPD